MSLNSYQQRDEDVLQGNAHRTVLPPSRYIPVWDNNRSPTLGLENNQLPTLIPEILLSSLQEGHRIQLSKGNTLKHSAQSHTREELSPVKSLNHRTVLPKLLPDPNRSQSQRRVVPPQGHLTTGLSETSTSTQQTQTDPRSSTSSQTMAKQAYEEELEFLQLKLRYMRNDIELKQRQIDNAKMLKLKSSTTAVNKWSQSSNNRGLVPGGKFQEVHQIVSSHGFPAQQNRFCHRTFTTAGAAADVSLYQVKAADSMLGNCPDLPERNVPSSVHAASNRFVMGPAGSKSTVTGSYKSSLTSTQSNHSGVSAGINKFSESNRPSLVTENSKLSTGRKSEKCDFVTERNKSSLITESNKPSLAAETYSNAAVYSMSSQSLPDTTLHTWKCASSSADVRIVYPSGVRSVSSHTNTAYVTSVNSLPAQPKMVARNQTAHQEAEQVNTCPANPSVLNKLSKEMPFSYQEPASRRSAFSSGISASALDISTSGSLASALGISASVFDRLKMQKIAEVPVIVPVSPDKRIVVASKMTPELLPPASAALDLTETLGHSPSLATVASEASTAHSFYASGDNIKDKSYITGLSHVPHTAAHSDSDPAWNPHSVEPKSRYRFVKPPSLVSVDIAKTAAVSIPPDYVNLPSSLRNFTSASSNMVPNKYTLAASRRSQASRLSLQNHCSVPAAVEVVNKYKLNRLSSASVPQTTSDLSPTKMILRESSAVSQADSQNAKTHHKFVSKYNLIKTPSHMSTISDSPEASVGNSVALPSSLYDSNMIQNTIPYISPVTAAAKRASVGSRFTFRNPNLKLHTAAKLVSKYKLKRLSPTSNPQSAPVFYNKLYKQPSLAYNNDSKKMPGQYSKNRLKLDRRLTAVSPANPKVSYKKLGGEYCSKLAQKHQIDHRPAVSQPPKTSDASFSLHKFTIDKRRKTDTIPRTKPMSPFYAGRNDLDGRVSKAGLFKSHITSKQITMDGRIRDCWCGPGTTGKVRSGRQVSTKYSWEKPCQVAAQSSRFKWSRPNVQAQNEAWQQLRQKLQLLLVKKHQHSRYKFFKYPTVAAPASAYSRRAQAGAYKTNLVTIDGVTYKSSTRKLIRTRRLSSKSAAKRAVTPAKCDLLAGAVRVPQRQAMKLISLRGVHFHVDQSGKKLCRTRSATTLGASAGIKRSTSVQADINIVNFANRVIHRSKAIATAKYKKNNQKSKTPHCKFFSRFGKCHRGDNCPYVHDPEKVAVCTRFLRGRCDVKDCPFSHKASVNKMPVCLFFLRGACARDGCPYLHVRVNPAAPVCKDFRNGFCALGEKCKKIHSHVCPSFAMSGVCSQAGVCTMLHRATSRKQQQDPPAQDKLKKASSEPCKSSAPFPEKSTITPDFSVPLAAQPSFISLDITPAASVSPQMTASTVTSLGTVPKPSFISFKAFPASSFISLTTPAPSFISLDITPAAPGPPRMTASTQSVTSLEATPAPSFISLEATPAPSFISLERNDHHSSTKNDSKPELAPQETRSRESGLEQEKSAKRTLLKIRPSFVVEKLSSQNS